jgi:hypothetical protein
MRKSGNRLLDKAPVNYRADPGNRILGDMEKLLLRKITAKFRDVLRRMDERNKAGHLALIQKRVIHA